MLQAADVLAYRTDEVPVGEDQREHLELTRDVAERFNARFGDTLWCPATRSPRWARGCATSRSPRRRCRPPGPASRARVYVLEEPDDLRRKFKRAVTDSGSEIVRAPDKPGVSNLVEILAVARGVEPEQVERELYGQGYGALKEAMGDAVVEYLAPVRERYGPLREDEAELEGILSRGAEKARAIASGVVGDVREAMGVGPRAAPRSWASSRRRAARRSAARSARAARGPSPAASRVRSAR